MLIEIILAIAIGISAGVCTGLIPGIHINLVSLLLLSMSSFFLQYTNVVCLAVFIISMATTHSFLDFIPGVFLGAPDADTALSILPGHKLLLEGRAFEAVKLTVIGSLGALILSALFVPIFIPLVGYIYPILKEHIGKILIVIMAFMILKDKNRKWNLLVFMMSGVLGLVVLNIPNLKDPLFPMLSGLFGLSMLVTSLMEKTSIPTQTFDETIEVDNKVLFKSLGAGTIAGAMTSFFPGLGPAQGAVLASQLVKDIGDFGFMILVGGLNTVNFVLSLISLVVLEKARNGAVVVILKLMQTATMTHLTIFLATALIAGGIATFLTMKITKIFARMIAKVDYQKLVITVILLIVILVFHFSGLIGLFVLFVATMVGIVPGELGVGRNHAMGCLILPVILYFIL